MAAIDRIADMRAISRVRERDVTLFSDDQRVHEAVRNRFGWTDLAEKAGPLLPDLKALGEAARAEGVTDIALLGMGGSSLAPLVIGSVLVGDGRRLRVLDTVAPVTIQRALDELDPATTWYLVASKSGGTVEPNSLYRIFRTHADDALGEASGSHFVAVTDPGSSLEALAAAEGFRATISAPADVGGRYSAISVFGLVPAALIGCDLDVMVKRAATAELDCAKSIEKNPAVELASFIIDSAEQGADKLTMVATGGLRTFSLWVEQLVAESLGKKGKGVVPVVELSDSPRGYGPDRAVVVMRMPGDERLAEWAASQRGRHPVYEIVLDDAYDIAEEFVRWEHAIAMCGALMGVNPFDEPNVSEAKAATEAVLDGSAEAPAPQGSADGINLTFAGGLEPPEHVERSAATAIGHALSSLRVDDYLGILAFLPLDPEMLAPLEEAAADVAAATGAAVCLELGPRYLHSTGQLYKGGPNNGVFIMITSADGSDIEVPGQHWGLKALHVAQAEGDLTALAAHGRRVLRLEIPDASAEAIAEIAGALQDAAAVVHEV